MKHKLICYNDNCKKEFTSDRKRKYCSYACSQLKYPDQKWKDEERICLKCKKVFFAKITNQKLCSRECAGIWNSFEYKAENGVGGRDGDGLFRLRFEVFKRDNFTCTYCGHNVKDDKVKLHCDHIIPKSKGGKDILENLTTACEACNLGKRDFFL